MGTFISIIISTVIYIICMPAIFGIIRALVKDADWGKYETWTTILPLATFLLSILLGLWIFVMYNLWCV